MSAPPNMRHQLTMHDRHTSPVTHQCLRVQSAVSVVAHQGAVTRHQAPSTADAQTADCRCLWYRGELPALPTPAWQVLRRSWNGVGGALTMLLMCSSPSFLRREWAKHSVHASLMAATHCLACAATGSLVKAPSVVARRPAWSMPGGGWVAHHSSLPWWMPAAVESCSQRQQQADRVKEHKLLGQGTDTAEQRQWQLCSTLAECCPDKASMRTCSV
jgi:hypothetical protein